MIPKLLQMRKERQYNPSLNTIPSKVAESKHDVAKGLHFFVTKYVNLIVTRSHHMAIKVLL